MKIGLFVHDFPPDFLGGTEQVVLALATAYRDCGHEVFVVAGSQRRDDDPKARVEASVYEGLRVLRVLRRSDENYGIRLDWPRVGALVTEVLREERPDVIHVHHWSTLGQDLVQRAAALGIPAGTTLHDLWTSCPRFFRRPPSGVRCPLDTSRDSCVACVGIELDSHEHAWIEGEIAQRDQGLERELHGAAFITVPSAAQRQLVERHVALKRPVEVVPHGLLAPVEGRSAGPRPGAKLRVGSFGNIVPEKGFDLLVEAMGNLGDVAELHLAGFSPHAGYVESLSQRARSLGISLVYHGAYGRGERHPALDIDLAVFPSLCHESYGLVVDEALARGVPVIVSGLGALPERAARGGRVVRQGGVGPLAVVLARLLRSRGELDALRMEVPAQFLTIHDAAARYLELFTAAGVA